MEMTAVMMESARKGMWKATPQQLTDIAKLQTETVNKYKPSCSGFVCDNAKLRNDIASKTDAASAKEYQQNVEQIRDAEAAKNSSDKGMVWKAIMPRSSTNSLILRRCSLLLIQPIQVS